MAGFDAHKNLAVSAVVTAPTPATSGTTLTVTAGEGARFPAPPFNATVWPVNAMPTPLTGEVIRVTARTTDSLTITRAQEGSTARAIGSGDLIAATITAKTLTDLETRAALKDEQNVFSVDQHLETATGPAIRLGFRDLSQPANARLFRFANSNQELGLFALDDPATAVLATPLLARRTGDVVVGRNLHEKGRTTAVGHWTAVPNNAGDFYGAGATVTVTTHLARAYSLVGTTLTYMFYVFVTLGGTPSTSIQIRLPAGMTAKGYSAATFLDGATAGMLQVAPGDAALNLYRDVGAGLSWVTGAHFLVGTIALEIT